MSDSAFYQLAPFVQEFIYRHRWDELRPFQSEAIAAILGAPQHVLICSATASGKTEAALLPIITRLHEDPPQSIGALYIGPLKALINDQFLRLNDLLDDSGIPVQSWHGDVPQSKKTGFLRRARGILQITPESLEAMLMRRHHELTRLFGDLRFVVIDEVHAFLASDRGRQVICQLERLSRVSQQPFRRIGLSATVGEPKLAMRWLQGNSPLPTRKIDSTARPPIKLALEYFRFPKPISEDEPTLTQLPLDADSASLTQLNVDPALYYAHMHSLTQRAAKTLIFANSRDGVEQIGLALRKISQREKLPSFYHVHHGNVSAPLRESAEAAMRAPDALACVAATVTLELGIDLGQLDQVIQVNATHTVSSFVQRLGRSGRRGGSASKMFFYCSEDDRDAAHIGEEMPWNLLQTIAIIQLYAEERWIEPPHIARLPNSLLYHQTMSTVYAHTELTPPQLAERVLGLAPFAQVTQDHFRALLRHLLVIDHLQQAPGGGLIIGFSAEKIVNHYSFFAVFSDETLFRVRDKSREIGTVQSPPAVDDTLVLAGYIWRVLHVDYQQRIIEVVRAQGRKGQAWHGGGPDIHSRVLQRMRQLLQTESEPNYLYERAKMRLGLARGAAKRAGLLDKALLPLANGRWLLLPWCGTRQFDTLMTLLRHAGMEVREPYTPYYAVLGGCNNLAELVNALAGICANPPSAAQLASQQPPEALHREKYDRFVPPELLRESYASDHLDLPGALACLRGMLGMEREAPAAAKSFTG
ncbi:MAG: DEAD/DEAH box helicase [Chloroflexi bacterium]|nr:DEAD/DEAH box helicase [Chloroflexota bacterium]